MNEQRDSVEHEAIYPRVEVELGNIHIDFNPLRDPLTEITSNPNRQLQVNENGETFIETTQHDHQVIHEQQVYESFQYHNLIKGWKYFTICTPTIIASSYVLGLCVKGTIDRNTMSYDNESLFMGMIGRWSGCEDNRWQIWRLMTNIFVHADFDHIAGNMIGFVIFSILLELYQPVKIIAPLFIVGVIQSNLAFYYIQPYSYSVGVSGGVFTLLGMNIANIIQNFNSIPSLQMFFIIYFSFFGLIGEATSYDEANNIAYIAHWTGIASGFFGGLTFLKKHIPHRMTSLISYSSFQFYFIFTFIVLRHYMYSWPPLESYTNVLQPMEIKNCCYEWYSHKEMNKDAIFENFTCPYNIQYDNFDTFWMV